VQRIDGRMRWIGSGKRVTRRQLHQQQHAREHDHRLESLLPTYSTSTRLACYLRFPVCPDTCLLSVGWVEGNHQRPHACLLIYWLLAFAVDWFIDWFQETNNYVQLCNSCFVCQLGGCLVGKIFWRNATVAVSLLFDKYCPIIV
jgi:hypothetical protein